MYANNVDSMQAQYDKKVADLNKIQRQLILQEEKMFELQKIQDEIAKGKESLQNDFISLQSNYDILRVEAKKRGTEYTKPFSKNKCSGTGNVQC